MAHKIDEVDAAILKMLVEDGRKSFRQIARAASVSTPTVENRFRKLVSMGVIKKISAILDPEKLEQGINAVISAKVDGTKLEAVAASLAQLDEVRSVYTTTGDSNLIINLVAADVRRLQELVTEKIAGPSLSVVSTNVITNVVKETQNALIRPGLGVKLYCAYCDRDIGSTPYTLRIGETERYFCCKTCQTAYKERYSGKIEHLIRQSQEPAKT